MLSAELEPTPTERVGALEDRVVQLLEQILERLPSAGCPCGRGTHPPASHLWTIVEVARAARCSVSEVRLQRSNPSCPLFMKGKHRGSRKLLFLWSEVEAFLEWVCRV